MRVSFFKTYEGLFERRLPEIPIEVLNWRVHASTALPHIALDFEGQRLNSGSPVKGQRRVHFPETGYVPCTIYNRYALGIGESFRGPAVIEERESTTVVGPDATITVDAHLNLVIEIDQLNAKDNEAHAVVTEATGA
jgi:N-methylhydantoinase A